jgi:hypothetical protein
LSHALQSRGAPRRIRAERKCRQTVEYIRPRRIDNFTASVSQTLSGFKRRRSAEPLAPPTTRFDPRSCSRRPRRPAPEACHERNAAPYADFRSRPADARHHAPGGRQAGLHQFNNKGNNFPQPSQTIWWRSLERGAFWPLLDLTLVSPEMGAPLMATDQQSYYNVEAGEWLIIGSYGIDSASDALRTFDTLIGIPVAPFVKLMIAGLSPGDKAAAFERLVSVRRGPFIAVGGARAWRRQHAARERIALDARRDSRARRAPR